jgi:hypothetical protein
MDVILRPLLGAGKASQQVVWVPLLLAATAVLVAWDPSPTLVDRFAAAGVAVSGLFPRRRRGDTYQGFVKALKACRVAGLTLDKRVAAFLRDRLRQIAEAGGKGRKGRAGGHWLRLGWCAFAADGSKFDVPRTKKNEAEFGTSGRKKSGPQQYLTSLWHMGTGLPWAWEQGPARSSERAHLRALLPLLPGGAEADGVLLVADAGFVGYDLLKDVAATGRHFLIRVGANVRLLTKLGWAVQERAGTVYLWPDGQQGKGRPPLVLRLIRLAGNGPGGKSVCLLTDVADVGRLSDETAGALYRMRWGVELFYRAAKQTLGRRKMCSAAPAQAKLELAWSVLGLMLLGVMAVERVVARAGSGVAAAAHDPLGWSMAAALRAVRRAARTPAARPRTPLADQLAGAVKDGYKRAGPKKARNWPHKKKDKPPGEPKLRDATDAEVALAKEIRDKKAAA